MSRPPISKIRQNIIEILAITGPSYPYEIFSIYKKNFPKSSLRSIYYQLERGLATKEFEIDKVVEEKGEYSWGSSSKRTYYKLGPSANPKFNLPQNPSKESY